MGVPVLRTAVYNLELFTKVLPSYTQEVCTARTQETVPALTGDSFKP